MDNSPLQPWHENAREGSLCWCASYDVSLTTRACVLCASLCVFTLRSRPEMTAPASSPLTRDLKAWYKTAVLVCSKFLPLAQNPWQVTMKHKGHRHMDLIQDATLGLNSLLTKRKENDFPLENLGRKGAEEQFSNVLHCTQRNLNQISALTGQAQLTIIISQKQYLLPTTVCKLNCLHNGPFVMALMYLSFSVSFFCGPRRKSCLVSVLPRLSPFLSQLLFHEIWLLVFCFFSISFSAKPEHSLLPCQPPLSVQHNVPKISLDQETILKLHSIKFAIPFQNRRNKLCFFTKKTRKKKNPLILGFSVCLCSTSLLSVCLFTPLRAFVFEHLFWTGNMSSTVADSSPMISFPQR